MRPDGMFAVSPGRTDKFITLPPLFFRMTPTYAPVAAANRIVEHDAYRRKAMTSGIMGTWAVSVTAMVTIPVATQRRIGAISIRIHRPSGPTRNRRKTWNLPLCPPLPLIPAATVAIRSARTVAYWRFCCCRSRGCWGDGAPNGASPPKRTRSTAKTDTTQQPKRAS